MPDITYVYDDGEKFIVTDFPIPEAIDTTGESLLPDEPMNVPVIERRCRPDLKYRIGCLAIKWIGRQAGIEIDFEPLALPGDRVTGMVKCPHCQGDNLFSVSLFNETRCHCRYCLKSFVTINDGTRIWLLLKREDRGRKCKQ